MTDSDTAPAELPYLGELRTFGFGFAPEGWASCDGREMPIKSNSALFALLGTAFGGNGQTTFNLPDLRARVPMHSQVPGDLGRASGEPVHTLAPAEMPIHNHQLIASNVASDNLPGPTKRLGNSQPGNLYGPGSNVTSMHPSVIGYTGGSEPHENRQPYLGLNLCICVMGEFPPKTEEETS